MITKFDSLYAGHVDMDNVGYGGTPVNDRSFSDEYLATAFDKAQAIAQTMDRCGYDTMWMAEPTSQPKAHVYSQASHAQCPPGTLTKSLKFGCGFNIAHVEPAAGRRLCHRRHSDQGPCNLRRRPRLPHPRSGDLWVAAAGPGRQPGPVRRAGRAYPQVL